MHQNIGSDLLNWPQWSWSTFNYVNCQKTCATTYLALSKLLI